MINKILNSLFRTNKNQPVTQQSYTLQPLNDMEVRTPRPSIYDRISQRRIAEEERERLAQALFPKQNFTSAFVTVVKAWVWLPGGVVDTPLPASELAQRRTGYNHDPRLLDSRGFRRPIRRLDTPGIRSPAVGSASRGIEILQAVLAQLDVSFYDGVDWSNTQVVLFAPSAISATDWFSLAVKEWPRGQLPDHGFDVQTQPPSQWLPQILDNSNGAEYLLCVSLDSWACLEHMRTCVVDQMVGEAASAVLLQRQSKQPESDTGSRLRLFAPVTVEHPPRATQLRTDTEALQQLLKALTESSGIDPAQLRALISDGETSDQRLHQLYAFAQGVLPGMYLEQQMSLGAISGRLGPATEQWVQIALAWLTASAEPGSAALILDRREAESTQGWLIG